jgi:hypothetical protein
MDVLPADAGNLWRSYVELHEADRRKEALAELDRFLEMLMSRAPAERDRFAEALAGAWLDPLEPADRPPGLLRYPVARDVLFPYVRARLGEARGDLRMAILLLTGSVAPPLWEQLPQGLSPHDLLERVAATQSGDTQARRWLLERLLQGLSYAFHELPSGVLAEVEELEADADWLEQLAPDYGRQDELAPVVAYVRDQATVLREFRARPDRSTSYEEFMDEKGFDWRNAPNPL